MAKLLYKENPMNGSILSGVSNSIDYLNQAINISYSMSIPRDFYERMNLERSKSELISTRNSLNDLKSWINNSNSTFKNTIGDMNNVAMILPKMDIKIRNLIVK